MYRYRNGYFFQSIVMVTGVYHSYVYVLCVGMAIT